MTINDTPDNLLNFITIFAKMEKMDQDNYFLNAIFESLRDILNQNPDDFFDIKNNSEVMNQAIKIFSNSKYYILSSEEIEIFSNNKFHYASIKNRSHHIIFFGKFAILKAEYSDRPKLYHLNPKIIKEFDPFLGSTPHELMDIELKLKKYFNDPQYGILNKIIYSILLMDKGDIESSYLWGNKVLYLIQTVLQKINIIAINDNFDPKENDLINSIKKLRKESEIIYNHQFCKGLISEKFQKIVEKSNKTLNEVLLEIS